jgi:hypothetical protein
MPRKSKRRTRRKRGGDAECNKVAHAICGNLKNFKTKIDVGDEHARYATRIRQEQIPCKPAFDEKGEPIMVKSRYGKDKNGNDRMEQKYVDEQGVVCLGKSYLASVPSRNIEDCKHSTLGSSQIFKECHSEKKYNPKSFSAAAFLEDRENRQQARTDYSLVGIKTYGGRLRRRKKSRKKRRKSKKRKSRRKRKRSRRRRRRR